jgi:hypothetical protein
VVQLDAKPAVQAAAIELVKGESRQVGGAAARKRAAAV